MPGPSLRLARTAPPEDGGLYRLILYGGVGHDDFETVAVMDLEGDPYRTVSWTGDIGVEVREHLTRRKPSGRGKSFSAIRTRSGVWNPWRSPGLTDR